MKRLLRKILRWAGYDIIRHQPDKHRRVARIANIIGVKQIFDVGANLGQFALAMRAAGYAGHIHSFEPLPNPFAQAQIAFAGDSGWTGHPYALGMTTERREILVAEGPGAASSFMPFSKLSNAQIDVRQIDQIMVEIRTLDNVLDTGDIGLDGPALLKLDVQGFEMAVLKGAKRNLAQFSLILLEGSFFQVYENEILIADLQDYLRQRNYRPVAVFAEFEIDPGVTLQADLLFADPVSYAAIQNRLQQNGR